MTDSGVPEVLVCGLLVEDTKVLLCHRRADREVSPGVWDLPGGHVEGSEETVDALRRELLEELGIEISLRDTSPWLTLSDEGIVLEVFLITEWQGDPYNKAPHEHDAIGWFGMDELDALDLAHPSYRDWIPKATP